MDKGRKVKDESPPTLVLFYAYNLQGSIFFKSTNFIPCTSTEGTSFLSNCLLKSTKKGPENAENQK